MIINRDGFEIYDLDDKLIEEFHKSEEKNSTQDLLSMDDMTDAHFRNFINGIRDGEKLHSPINEGNISVTILLLSNIAWRLNRILNLDKENAHILNDEEAMKYWQREYEPGWEIKL